MAFAQTSVAGVRPLCAGRRTARAAPQVGGNSAHRISPISLCIFLVRWRPDAPLISLAYPRQYLLSPRCLLLCMRSLQLMQIVRQLF